MYTLEAAISDYQNEVKALQRMKARSHTEVSKAVWDADDTEEVQDMTVMMDIDKAIESWQKKLDELKTGNVNPEDYRY